MGGRLCPGGMMTDATHDAKRRSWVESANGHPDFPIQNLPFGIYNKPGERPRGGIAIGHDIFDLKIASEAGLFSGEAKRAADAAGGSRLNGLFAFGAGPRAALRARLFELLDADGPERKQVEGMKPLLLSRAADCAMHLPARIGNFTDFFAGIHHATNAGQLLRPDNPLLPNYKHIPVAYHGRASSIRVSGTDVRRPSGQRKPQSATEPISGRAAISTTSWSSASGSGRAMSSARRSRSARRATTSPASACSTTGRRATSRPGSTSRSVRSSPRISPRRCRPGW